jgi:hypothetical protein
MRITLSLLLLVTAVESSAEPGPTIQYLMNEPVTLMDLGMYRLRRKFDDFQNSKWLKEKFPKYLQIDIMYRDKEDRLEFAVFYLEAPDSKEEATADCKELIITIKSRLSIDKDGTPHFKPVEETSNLYSYFSHYSDTKRDPRNYGYNPNKDLGNSLDDLTKVIAVVGTKDSYETVCQSKLRDPKIFIEDYASE